MDVAAETMNKVVKVSKADAATLVVTIPVVAEELVEMDLLEADEVPTRVPPLDYLLHLSSQFAHSASPANTIRHVPYLLTAWTADASALRKFPRHLYSTLQFSNMPSHHLVRPHLS